MGEGFFATDNPLTHHRVRQHRAALSQPKSDSSDFGRLKVPNSGKPEFGWERAL
jgi:hypothetical protein